LIEDIASAVEFNRMAGGDHCFGVGMGAALVASCFVIAEQK
jgi:hypothetical protein